MHHDLLKQKQGLTMQSESANKHSKHFDMIWGKWLGGGKDEEKAEGGRTAWEDWLQERGLMPGGGREEAEAHGWSEPIDSDDISDMDDEDTWIAGGMRRPGERGSEDFSSDEVMNDDWDDDDDDHGGEMMPVPTI